MDATVRGSGPAVLLLHGQPGDRSDWDAVASSLEDRFTVIAPDRPGYGQTSGPAGGFDLNARAAAGLLDRLGVERAVVAGHSWGGGVALAMAQRFPERVAALALIASIGVAAGVDWFDRLLGLPAAGVVLSFMGFRALGRVMQVPRARERMVRAAKGIDQQYLSARAAALLRTPAWRSFLEEHHAYLNEIAQLDSALEAVEAPTVVVTGERDHIVRPVIARQLVARIRGATLVEIPRAGHFLPLQAPDRVAEAIGLAAARVV